MSLTEKYTRPRPGLHIELAQDHTKFLVELPSGHHILVPVSGQGAIALAKLLKQQVLLAVTESEEAKMADFQSGQRAMIDHWLQYGVGSEVSPTQQKFDHDLRHDPRWPRPNCVFCRQEEAEKAARRRVRKAKDKVYRSGTPELSLEDLD